MTDETITLEKLAATVFKLLTEDQAKERAKRLRELDDFFTEAEAYARAKSAAGPQGRRREPLSRYHRAWPGQAHK